MEVTAIKTKIFKEREDLNAFVYAHIPILKDGSVLAVASKIVALSEGRTILLRSKKEKEALIKRESEWAQRILPEWWLTVRDGTVVVNAGLDDSNVHPVRGKTSNGAGGKTILLPKDSFKSAEKLRAELCAHYKIKKLGIVITDSRIMPLRAGVMGIALGYAGFRGIRDYRGTPDLFGRKLKVTQTDIADSLATAATVVMGEGAERQPLAILEEVPVEFVQKVKQSELKISRERDMYRFLFKTGTRKKK